MGPDWPRKALVRSSSIPMSRLVFRKGFGDLPDTLSGIRPIAVTGQIATRSRADALPPPSGVDPDSGDPTV